MRKKEGKKKKKKRERNLLKRGTLLHKNNSTIQVIKINGISQGSIPILKKGG